MEELPEVSQIYQREPGRNSGQNLDTQNTETRILKEKDPAKWWQNRKKLITRLTAAGVVTTATISGLLFAICEEAETGPQVPTSTPTATARKTPAPALSSQTPEVTPSPTAKPSETPTPAPTEAPTPQPSVYEQLSETIAISGLSEVQKQEAQTILTELSQIDLTRAEFLNAYNANLDEQGQPLLLTLLKEKYKRIPPSQLPGFDPANPNTVYENKIFFVTDQKAWDAQTKPVLESLTGEQSPEIILAKLQELQNINQGQKLYLESNTKSGTNIEVNSFFTPQTPEEQGYLDQTLSHIEALKQKIPLFGNYQINIVAGPASNSGYHPDTDLLVINIAVEKPEPYLNPLGNQASHELAHSLITQTFPYFDSNGQQHEVLNFIRFNRYHSPQELVEIMTNEQKIMTDSQIGALYGSDYQGNYEDPLEILKKPQLTSQDITHIARRVANIASDNWRSYPPPQRYEASDIEWEAELLATFFEYRDRIISDTSIDKLDFQNQLLKVE